ncbi:nucleotide disphospho-sugar-binding domain-containing protein [Kitasatospora sp. NPDC001540]|uniref:nucleotide disphospho-sugar-binding domain-containing protein n=1 Tax=Kitasatospora sp. NPDC001540 TaxID=3364014 RepID=UPI0036934FD6
MRVLFTTFPWHSHHFPMVPIEQACLAAGHEVRVASTPALQPIAAASGLPFVPVGRDVNLAALSNDRSRAAWHRQERWPQDWPIHPELLNDDQFAMIENLGRMQAVMADAMLDDLLEYARAWRPDLVVHDAVTLAGPVVASALGIPSVSHLWGTPGPQRIEMRRFGSEPIPEYAALYERVGAPLRAEPTAWLDPCAPGTRYEIGPTCRQVRYVPYNGPGVMPLWPLEPRRGTRICVTWGATSTALRGDSVLDLVSQCIRAATSMADEVVVAVTDRAVEGLKPVLADDRVRLATNLPLHLFMGTCDLVVHHGGAGTSLTAALAGVPQLAITARPEPSVNGARLAAAGAAQHFLTHEVPAGEDGVRLLRGEIAELMGFPGYRSAARELAQGILAQPTPAATVAELESVARGGQPLPSAVPLVHH